MTANQVEAKSAMEETFGRQTWVDGETWNGRLAMLGFVVAIAVEVAAGQSLLPKIW
jgi:hypothetical protein